MLLCRVDVSLQVSETLQQQLHLQPWMELCSLDAWSSFPTRSRAARSLLITARICYFVQTLVQKPQIDALLRRSAADPLVAAPQSSERDYSFGILQKLHARCLWSGLSPDHPPIRLSEKSRILAEPWPWCVRGCGYCCYRCTSEVRSCRHHHHLQTLSTPSIPSSRMCVRTH